MNVEVVVDASAVHVTAVNRFLDHDLLMTVLVEISERNERLAKVVAETVLHSPAIS